jgi:hypothetical protein
MVLFPVSHSSPKTINNCSIIKEIDIVEKTKRKQT